MIEPKPSDHSHDHRLGNAVDDQDAPSKSRRKRDADAVRELGRHIAELGASERAGLPLPEDVRDAVEQLIRIRSHSARKRQLGLLAKRLRNSEIEPIVQAVEAIQLRARAQVVRHHEVERWRDRLLGEHATEPPAAALTAFLDTYPDIDRQRLRQLQQQALADRSSGRDSRRVRELFRLIREPILSANPESSANLTNSVDQENEGGSGKSRHTGAEGTSSAQ